MFLSSLSFPGDQSQVIDNPIAGQVGGNPTLGDIISRLMPYAFAIAGLILFVMLSMGGFTLLTSVGNPDKIHKGKDMIIYSLVGFLIIFAAYWIMQLLQIIFGLELGF